MSKFSPTPTFVQRFIPWGVALISAVAIAPTLLPSVAHAQSSAGDASELGEWQTNERDSRSIGGTGLTPLELIQQLRSLSGQSPAEFESRQEGRLDAAAESFRRQQQQRLGTREATPEPAGNGDR